MINFFKIWYLLYLCKYAFTFYNVLTVIKTIFLLRSNFFYIEKCSRKLKFVCSEEIVWDQTWRILLGVSFSIFSNIFYIFNDKTLIILKI